MSLPAYEDPSLSFLKLKRVRMGDEVLKLYQKKLLELREKHCSEVAKITTDKETFSFYLGSDRIGTTLGEEEEDDLEIGASDTKHIQSPTDNVFAYFLFLPSDENNNGSHKFYLYWNPNLECEENPNLNWDLTKLNELSESRVKEIAIDIKNQLTESGFESCFKSIHFRKYETINLVEEDDKDDEYPTNQYSSSCDSDLGGLMTKHKILHFQNQPCEDSYPRDYTSYDLND